MPDEPQTNEPQNSTPPSLRDIAEAAYDEVESVADDSESPADEGAEQEPVASDERPRDKQGRWVAKEQSQPGEAIEPKKADPAPKQDTETRAAVPDPAAAPTASSNQAPGHWSAEDKATFAKLPPEGQAFLLKRHGEMEAAYTRASQEHAGAVQFTQSLAPVFTDRRIQQSLQQNGLNPSQAIHEWAGLHLRIMSPNPQDKFSALVDITQRAGLDPARIFSALSNRPQLPEGLSEAELKDPAVKVFADQIGQLRHEHNAFRAEIQRRWDQEHQARVAAGEQSAKANIDQWADEVGKDGQPLRPYFNTVLPILLDLFKANPQRSMSEAYDAACWAHPEVRKQLLATEQMRQQAQADVARAKVAQRGNVRGLTSPASKPPGPNGVSKGGLRDVIEASAEEVGL